MGSIFFQFQGLCVNLAPRAISGGALLHRVVLPNVSESEVIIKNHTIIGHQATIAFGEETPVSLVGYEVRILNALSTGFDYELTFQLGIPNLSQMLMAENQMDLGPPSDAYVTGVDPDLIAARFAFGSGAFSSCTILNGAAVTNVVIQTEGDPIVRLEPFPTSTGAPIERELTSGTQITVVNMEGTEGPPPPPGEKFDFLASYLLAQSFAELPDTLPIPPFALASPCTQLMHDFVGAECSNSNYP